MKTTVTIEKGNFSGGVICKPYFSKTLKCTSKKEAEKVFAENAIPVFGAEETNTFTYEGNKVFFSRRGWGISDCSEYIRVAMPL